MRPSWRYLALGGLLNVLTAAAGLTIPLAAERLIDGLGSGRPLRGVLLLMGVLVVVTALAGPLGQYVLRRAAESIVLTARRRLSSHLLRLRVPEFDRTEPGDLIARVTSDTTLLRQVTADSLVGTATGALTLVVTTTLMCVLDPVLTAVTLGVLVLAGWIVRTVMSRVNEASTAAQESVGLVGAALERAFGALRTVKASGAEERAEAAVHDAAHDSWRAGVRAAKWLALAGNTAELAMQIAFFTVLAVGGARVASGELEAGRLIAFLMYVFYLVPAVQQLVGGISQYHLGAAAVTRIQEAERLRAEDLPAGPGNGRIPLPGPGREPASLEFRDLHFRYSPELPPVHRGVSFTVPPRGITAFVGPSGAGKTTLFSLIERFYEPTGGSVLVDGRELGRWDIRELRSVIGYVEQDAPVISGSLRDNLLLGCPGADGVDIRHVLRTARLDDLVRRLPQGLDTPVGHRGTMLSGGQRQRVAIARALLRRPRLLLLDEATSQLDAVNEAALRDTVADIARTTTVLVVAHRLSTVALADRIVVLDGGVVRAVGTHAELVAADPLYAELAATQFLQHTN
ncbi:ABC transporter ATP-binding protein [Streptomyces sp. GC420]|uniref:ABC transporter ATP-binding protein n=1 Tax=Streptomyces sp. GC420 TaxID=2697568 RepID=UPI00141508E4|nr:ABC transporter ATP-binding protein [Streptomyces sp. GC420]NBM20885.1 ATP-binding cassette domain-containing protein [Streptomyces sp. GC420]